MKTLIEFLIATKMAEQDEATVTFDHNDWYLQVWFDEWRTVTTLLVDEDDYTARCNENGEELEFPVTPKMLRVRNANTGMSVYFGVLKMKKFKYCDCLQVTAHHAAYPDNVSYFFEEKCYYKNGEELKVELYSCGCEDCFEAITWDAVISAHYLPALINDDWTGLEGGEANCLTSWLIQNNLGQAICPDDVEPSFCRCDVTGLFGDCINVKFYRLGK